MLVSTYILSRGRCSTALSYTCEVEPGYLASLPELSQEVHPDVSSAAYQEQCQGKDDVYAPVYKPTQYFL